MCTGVSLIIIILAVRGGVVHSSLQYAVGSRMLPIDVHLLYVCCHVFIPFHTPHVSLARKIRLPQIGLFVGSRSTPDAPGSQQSRANKGLKEEWDRVPHTLWRRITRFF